MNLNIVKKIGLFTLGLAIGSLTAYLMMREEKYIDITNEEVSVGRENHERFPQEYENNTENLYKEEEKVLVLNKDRYKKIVRRYNGDYTNIPDDSEPGDNIKPADDEDEEELRQCEKMSDEVNYKSNKDPYVISLSEFSDECDHFDKVTIYYYEDDWTLVDEDQEVINDHNSVIGPRALGCFGEDSEDPDIVYVRNENIQIDYEVIRLPKSYSQTMGGGSNED
jgi:hypothetical protein